LVEGSKQSSQDNNTHVTTENPPDQTDIELRKFFSKFAPTTTLIFSKRGLTILEDLRKGSSYTLANQDIVACMETLERNLDFDPTKKRRRESEIVTQMSVEGRYGLQTEMSIVYMPNGIGDTDIPYQQKLGLSLKKAEMMKSDDAVVPAQDVLNRL
jgi:hypothetical protein